MDKITITAEAEINPTESEERVKRAVENVLGALSVQVKPQPRGSILVAEGEGEDALSKLHDLLRRERIRSAARTVFLAGVDRKSISFCLNKQVAYAGHVSFSKEVSESPLGPIRVKIECDEPRRLIDWLTSGQ